MTLSANNECVCLRLCLCTSFGAHIFFASVAFLLDSFAMLYIIKPSDISIYIHVQRLNFSIVIEAKFVFVAAAVAVTASAAAAVVAAAAVAALLFSLCFASKNILKLLSRFHIIIFRFVLNEARVFVDFVLRFPTICCQLTD